MEISQISIAVFCAVSFAFGIVFGLLYDIVSPLIALCGKVYSEKLNERLYASRKGGKRESRFLKAVSSIAVFWHDLIYMICFGAAFATLTYIFNDGIVRLSSLIATAVGVVLYRKTARRYVLALAEWIRFAVFCAINTVARALILPFRAVCSLFKRVVRYVQKEMLEGYTARYSKKTLFETLALAERGFVLDVEKNRNRKKGKRGYERCGKKEKNNNFCDIVYADGVGDRFRCESDELQSAPQGSHSSRAKKRRT